MKQSDPLGIAESNKELLSLSNKSYFALPRFKVQEPKDNQVQLLQTNRYFLEFSCRDVLFRSRFNGNLWNPFSLQKNRCARQRWVLEAVLAERYEVNDILEEALGKFVKSISLLSQPVEFRALGDHALAYCVPFYLIRYRIVESSPSVLDFKRGRGRGGFLLKS